MVFESLDVDSIDIADDNDVIVDEERWLPRREGPGLETPSKRRGANDEDEADLIDACRMSASCESSRTGGSAIERRRGAKVIVARAVWPVAEYIIFLRKDQLFYTRQWSMSAH